MLMKLGRAIRLLIEAVTSALVLVIAGILLLQVIGRHILSYSFPWPEEVAGFLFVWLVFLGAFVSYLRGNLIGIDWFVQQLPRRGAVVVQAASRLLVISLLVAMVWLGTEVTIGATGQRTTVLRFSWAWIYAALPAGFGLLLIAVLEESVRFIRRHWVGVDGTDDRPGKPPVPGARS